MERSGTERSERARSGGTTTTATAAASPLAGGVSSVPDPEVPERPARRRYAASYKVRIVREADACTKPGAVGSLLRREGLYSSLLTSWRRLRDKGALWALKSRKRGRKARSQHPLVKKVAQLERENRLLEHRLKRAELLLDIQEKVSQALAMPLGPTESEEID